VDKLQQQTTVDIHRSRHVADHEQLRPFWPPLPITEFDEFTASLEIQTQRAPQIYSATTRHRTPSPAAALRQSSRHAASNARNLLELFVAKSSEIFFRTCFSIARARHVNRLCFGSNLCGPMFEKKCETTGGARRCR